MNARFLLTALIAGVAIAVLLFLLRMTQTVDNDLHLERVRNIRAVDALDVRFNRATTQAGVADMTNMGSARGEIVRLLGEALEKLDKGPQRLSGLTPELDKALETFLDTIDGKIELGYYFDSNTILLNQRLIGNIDAVPLLAAQLEAATDAAAKERVRELTTQLKAEITTLGVVQGAPNGASSAAILTELDTIGATQSDAFRQTLAGLRMNAEGAIADKTELMEQAVGIVGRPTGPQLETMEKTYLAWHADQVEVANRYRLLLAAYAAILMIGLALLGFRLRRSFQDLDHANEKLVKANENLEGQVQERTQELSKTLKTLQESEAQLIHSEKMASLGQMIAGVAHEINTPLAYARSNARMVRDSLLELREVISVQDHALAVLTAEEMSEEEAAAALTHAHVRREEVNPNELAKDLDTLLRDAGHGLTQIAELVGSLKDFSRVDRSRHDMFNVNHGLESALKIAHHHLKTHIEVIREFGELPDIECAPSQINQVFLNLITNAAQAVEGEGKLFIRTAREGDNVVVRIRDTGCGMTPEVKAKIFEPFFTTKAVGQGTGLGLSIVFRIIEDHGGRIEVDTAPGKGTEFTLRLPLRQKTGDAAPVEKIMARVATA